jgi:signal transduction histidine kinase/ligand-binding sensor domain-containing protein
LSASSSRYEAAILACLLWAGSALALDPTLDASQYGHTAWRIRDGFAKGTITSFAQTPDGYLWMGGEFGLLRFDGVRATPWVPPPGSAIPGDGVRALLVSHDGTLWIGAFRGLAAWDGRKLRVYPQLDGSMINTLHEDRDGALWIGGAGPIGGGLLCVMRREAAECQGGDGRFGTGIGGVYEQASGVLWVAAWDRLWRWKPSPPKPYPLPDRIINLQVLTETQSGTMLVATLKGIQEIKEPATTSHSIPASARKVQATALLRDRDGALWIGTRDAGILHVHRGRTDVFTPVDGLSGHRVNRFFEDREGSIWASTVQGVDRFRGVAAAHYARRQGLTSTASMLATPDGSIWISTRDGLKRWRDGTMSEVEVRGLPKAGFASLFRDSRGRIWVGTLSTVGYVEHGAYTAIAGVPPGAIDSFAEDKRGNLWLLHRKNGLIRIHPHRRAEVAWEDADTYPRWLAPDPIRGGMWIGSYSGRLIRVLDGRVVESYSERDGLGKPPFHHVSVSKDGAAWVATAGGFSRIQNGRVATLDAGGGLPCDRVNWMIEGAEHALWVSTACGLVRVEKSELDAWAAAVDAGTARPRIAAGVVESYDQVRAFAAPGSFTPHAAVSGDGKLWLAGRDGATMVDPRDLRLNKQPPPVHVESIVADRKPYDTSSGVQLPPLVRDVHIEYTATSLVAPEKMQFKYKLEGRDKDWNDAGNRRQAFYTDLDPGDYRFRVIASNNSGVWNEQGAALEFSVAPAYWQTWWFRALCVAVLAALLWALYRWRVRQIAREFGMTLDARVAERTRIARDLHDTLLQSFHGLLLRFQTVLEMMPGGQPKELLASTIDQAAEAITEGRDAVQGLRSSVAESNDLADAIRALGEQLAADQDGEDAALCVEVQGAPRALRPIVRDDVFRIAGEALRNAFRHAGAKRIEVELRYDSEGLRLRVRDDGKGIDAKVLSQGGREGHFGLHGMRERATLIGGKLAVWSTAGSGTEIDLSIPALRAYASS